MLSIPIPPSIAAAIDMYQSKAPEAEPNTNAPDKRSGFSIVPVELNTSQSVSAKV